MAQNRFLSKGFQKQKNILDLTHQRHLNYFNIFMISLITIAFSSILGFVSGTISADYLATLLILDMAIFGFLSAKAYATMNVAFGKILKL